MRREAWQLCLSIRGDAGGGESRKKNKCRGARVAVVLLVDDQEPPILVDDVFKRDQRPKMCFIKFH